MRDKDISEFKIYQVNAFVEEEYQGNPAGVCLLPQERREDYYIKAAMKVGLSETAFIYKMGDILHLRWFTRNGSEVDLCGHATLATAWLLWEKKYVNAKKIIHFQTRSGVLSAKLEGDFVTLEFPLGEITSVGGDVSEIEKYLGVPPVYLGKTTFDYLVVVDSEETVKNLAPDFERLKDLPVRGIIVTAKSLRPEYNYINRFFAPGIGINEDPVTGSAHSYLGVYWSSVLKKNSLVGYQASLEGGIVRVTVLENSVLISGKAREVPVPEALREAVMALR